MDSDVIHHLVDKLDYLEIVSNSRSINFSSVIAIFVFYQKGYYIIDIIDTQVWILLSPLYKYPTKLLIDLSLLLPIKPILARRHRSLVVYVCLVTELFNALLRNNGVHYCWFVVAAVIVLYFFLLPRFCFLTFICETRKYAHLKGRPRGTAKNFKIETRCN